ncbi:MAG: hypothetical protein C0502_02870 [Opitutus sp.]|nr:hypothetical protein [Opitutus sp.]
MAGPGRLRAGRDLAFLALRPDSAALGSLGHVDDHPRDGAPSGRAGRPDGGSPILDYPRPRQRLDAQRAHPADGRGGIRRSASAKQAMKLSRLTRAEYVCRPGQLFRRAARLLRRPFSRDRMTVQLPWGFPITVNPRESIGRSIVALSALDLPVTETIWRLLDDGESCADIGANIGYMTSVMAARLRSGGAIWSFEPVPEIAAELRQNFAAWRPYTRAEFRFHAEALAEAEGERDIHLAAEFAENRGTASLQAPGRGATRALRVRTRRLDALCAASTRFGLVKLDVEGAEALVLRGAERLLREGLIRDLVFEEHNPWPAASTDLLRRHGYQLWRVTRGRRGPALVPADAVLSGELDPPTYLASRETGRVLQRFAAASWLCLAG